MVVVNLIELGAAAIAGTVAATGPIRRFSETPKNARFKLDGSVVTDADFAAQGCIICALRLISNEIRIVGEESPEEMQAHLKDSLQNEYNVYEYAKNELLHRYYRISMDKPPLSECEESSTDLEPFKEPESTSEELPESLVDASRVTVLVDPLDGTKCYAQGDYDSVTILTAIILDNIPVFGVITKPFKYKGYSCLRNTGCFTVYGGTLVRGVFQAGATDPFQRNRSSERPRAMISKSRSEGIVAEFFDRLGNQNLIHPDPIHVSGAGEKALRLIVGSQDEMAWLFPLSGTSRWDVAALDALLRQTGGKLTNKYGEPLDYSKSREDAENTEGIIACSDEALHTKCMEVFLSGSWEEDFQERLRTFTN